MKMYIVISSAFLISYVFLNLLLGIFYFIKIVHNDFRLRYAKIEILRLLYCLRGKTFILLIIQGYSIMIFLSWAELIIEIFVKLVHASKFSLPYTLMNCKLLLESKSMIFILIVCLISTIIMIKNYRLWYKIPRALFNDGYIYVNFNDRIEIRRQ